MVGLSGQPDGLDVVDVNEVARLLNVAVDSYRPATPGMLEEDLDDAGSIATLLGKMHGLVNLAHLAEDAGSSRPPDTLATIITYITRPWGHLGSRFL